MLPNLDNNNINNENNNNSILNNNINSSYNAAMNNEIVLQLIELGYNSLYSTRIFIYYHPQNIDEALNYLNIDNGIIQHHFVQERENLSSDICFLCGESKEIHLGYIPEAKNSINNDFSLDTQKSNNDISFEKKGGWKEKKCKKCKTLYLNNEGNTLEICKHSFCNKCWYIYISTNIKNKIKSPYKCLNNKCKENISDKFIFNLLKNHREIILNYKSYMGKSCDVCENIFIPNKENTIPTCNHSFCNDCWYKFLSIKIQENKISFIKCLNYECREKISDIFIINLLNSNDQLIQKYKKFKLEFEILKDPKKKFCPIPNCISYLELKNKNNLKVKCKNGHVFCFNCLEKPHGNSPCKNILDNSLLEFSKQHFIKKCPNCSIITEKIEGCNHITCSKCSYQWCWLCNGKYDPEHFLQGKCKGFQFFKPKNENDIKLALEGKIELSLSQRQIDEPYEENNNHNNNIGDNDIANNINGMRRIRHFNILPSYYYRFRWGWITRIFLIFIYIMFGQDLFNLNMMNQYNNLPILYGTLFYLPYKISFFFVTIYINIISSLYYFIKEGFMNFTSLIYDLAIFRRRFSKFRMFFFSIYILFFELFLFTYFICIRFERQIGRINRRNQRINRRNQRINRRNQSHNILILVICHLNTIIFIIIFFPFQFLLNIFFFFFLFYVNFNIYYMIEDINDYLNDQTSFCYDLNESENDHY